MNPVAPVAALVADSGEFITFDNWHNIGTGDPVIAIYAADGKVHRRYRLADMYTEAEISKFDHTVSSIWWRCPGAPVLDNPAGLVEFADMLGAIVRISLATGAVTRKAVSEKPCHRPF